MRKYIYVGCSHTKAIRLAVEARKSEGVVNDVHIIHLRDAKYVPEVYGATESNPLGDAVRNYLGEQLPSTAHGAIISCLHGNFHNILGLMQHPIPFDFILHESPDLPLDRKARIIPCQLLLDFMGEEVKKEAKLLSALRNLDDRVYHVESPPPVRNEEHILRYADDYFSRRSIDTKGVSPPWLRYKLWRLYSLLVKAECERLGIRYVETPRSVCDEDGFLDARGYYHDATHANAWYGEAVLKAIESLRTE